MENRKEIILKPFINMKMQIPAECERCGKMFDLNDDIQEKDMDKKVGDVINEKCGGRLLCVGCR